MTTSTTNRKQRTITLSRRAPVKIWEDEWPIAAQATGDSYRGGDHGGYQRALSNAEFDKYRLVVRVHADGRAIVYGKLSAAIEEWGQPARGASWGGGEILPAGSDLAAAISRVGGDGGLPDSLIRECIADLPAEEI